MLYSKNLFLLNKIKETQLLQEKHDLKQFFKWIDRVQVIRNEVIYLNNNICFYSIF